MKLLSRFALFGLLACGGFSQAAANQTPDITPIQSDRTLPFQVKLKRANFCMPQGVQSYQHAIYKDFWLIITGRTDGLHGFANSPDNFPARAQNTVVYVVDSRRHKIYSRDLKDPHSGLTQEQIDLLSVTAAQSYQTEDKKTLYITGGYGIDTASGQFTTKDCLSAINVPGLIRWVVKPRSGETAAQHIRQIFDPIFQVTGGYMNQIGNNPTLLIVGQDFEGVYHDPSQPATQVYTEQVRRFRILDNGKHLSFEALEPRPLTPDPNYRRRDLNVVPTLKLVKGHLKESFTALSGVFTPPPDTGIWTVPVEVTADGIPSMANPGQPTTFKQGMNNYDSAVMGLFSEKSGDMFHVIFGGMSFGFFENCEFKTDDEIPFINQTTTIKVDRCGHYSQHLMRNGSFPKILSRFVNPGNPLLFGSECEVFLFHDVPKYRSGILKLDAIKKPTVIGYIIGGIASTLPNTNTYADSFSSPLIFKVIVEPNRA